MPDDALIHRYARAGVALLPPGPAFDRARNDDSALYELIAALSVEFARIHEEAEILLRNTAPLQAEEYLDEWEEVLGLPGSCVATPPTSVTERAGAIVAALRGRSSHAKAVYEAAAEAMGYTNLEFVKYDPMTVGMSVGNPVYGDEWAHVVSVYVPVDTQTADDQLVCTFVDQLRRSHTFIDVILEGPIGAERKHVAYYDGVGLGQAYDLDDIAPIGIRYGGHVSIQCTVAQGDRVSTPTDGPKGSWELWCSVDGHQFTQLTSATSELDKIKANDNVLINDWVIFEGVPGSYIKLRYNRLSGGAISTKAFVDIVHQ